MNEDNPNKPELRVLPKERELERLESPDSSERMRPAKPAQRTGIRATRESRPLWAYEAS